MDDIGSIKYNSTDQCYEITNLADFQAFAAYVNGDGTEGSAHDCAGLTFKVTATELDLTGVTWESLRNFSGTFDGNGCIIKNLTVNDVTKFQGLFSWITDNAVVKNVKLTDANVTGGDSVGALVGWSWGTVENCEVTNSTVTGSKSSANGTNGDGIGGLVGTVEGGTIKDCFAEGITVTGTNYVGSIVGLSKDSTVSGKYCSDIQGVGYTNAGTDNTEKLYLIPSTMPPNIYSIAADSSALSYTYTKDGKTYYTYGATFTVTVDSSVTGNYDIKGATRNQDGTFTFVFGADNLDFEFYSCPTIGNLEFDADGGFYKISSVADLQAFANYVNGDGTEGSAHDCKNLTFKVTENINLKNITWTPINNFAGTFDGGNNGTIDKGYKISNLTIDSTSNYQGLFGTVDGGTIKNVTMDGANVTGQKYVSALVANLIGNGTVEDCSVINSTVKGISQVGGLVGNIGSSTDKDGTVINGFVGNVTATRTSGNSSQVACMVGNNWGTVSGQYCGSSPAIGYNRGSYGAIDDTHEAFTDSSLSAGITATCTNSDEGYSFTAKDDKTYYKNGATFEITVDNSVMSDTTTGKFNGIIGATETGTAGKYNFTLSSENPEVKLNLLPNINGITLNNETNIYEINSAQGLQALATYVNSGYDCAGLTFKLTGDIVLNAADNFNAIGTADCSFAGIFDGNSHKISNLTINSLKNYQGLFGKVDGGTVKNVNLENVNIEGGGNVGALVGELENGTVDNCSVTGGNVKGKLLTEHYTEYEGITLEFDVFMEDSGSCIGGLVGYSANSQIGSCAITNLKVESDDLKTITIADDFDYDDDDNLTYETYTNGYYSSQIGGLVGNNNGSKIENCQITGGTVNGGTGSEEVGGLIGYNNGKITDNTAVNNTVKGSDFVGGLVGYNNSTITRGTVLGGTTEGVKTTGGLVGKNESGGTIVEALVDTSFFSNNGEFGYIVGENFGRVGGYYCYNEDNVKVVGNSGGKVTAQKVLYRKWLDGLTVTMDINNADVVTRNGLIYYKNDPDFSVNASVTYDANKIYKLNDAKKNADGTYKITFDSSNSDAKFIAYPKIAGLDFVANTYYIQDAQDLVDLATYVNANDNFEHDCAGLTFKVTADIDLSTLENGVTFRGIGTAANSFVGTFDGGGYKIKNLTINSTSVTEQGLFGWVGKGGTVKDVELEGVSIEGGTYGGAIAGYNYGTIENCAASGTVKSESCGGGIVGYNYGTVSKCANSVNVTVNNGKELLGGGGIVGTNQSGTVEKCVNSGNVTVNGDKGTGGGIVGINLQDGKIESCLVDGDFTVTATKSYVVGSNGGDNQPDLVEGNYYYNRKNAPDGLTQIFKLTLSEDAKDITVSDALEFGDEYYAEADAIITLDTKAVDSSAYEKVGIKNATPTTVGSIYHYKMGSADADITLQNYPKIDGLTFDKATDTYTIADAQDLVDLAAYVNGDGTEGSAHDCAGLIFKITTDIDLSTLESGVTFAGIGTATNAFAGTFDGDGKVIDKLSSVLFVNAEGATISNVKVLGAAIVESGTATGENNYFYADGTSTFGTHVYKVTAPEHFTISDLTGGSGFTYGEQDYYSGEVSFKLTADDNRRIIDTVKLGDNELTANEGIYTATISADFAPSASYHIQLGDSGDSYTNAEDKISIKGGAGSDLITNTGSNVTIDSGAGNDLIIAGGDNVSITTGDGKDIVQIFADGTDKNIKIEDFVADDTIRLVGTDGNAVNATAVETVAGGGIKISYALGGETKTLTVAGINNVASIGSAWTLEENVATYSPTTIEGASVNNGEIVYQNAAVGEAQIKITGISDKDKLNVDGNEVSIETSAIENNGATIDNADVNYTFKIVNTSGDTTTRKLTLTAGDDKVVTEAENVTINTGQGSDTIKVGADVSEFTVEDFTADDELEFIDTVQSLSYENGNLVVTLAGNKTVTVKGLTAPTRTDKTWLTFDNGTAQYGKTVGTDFVKSGKKVSYGNFEVDTYFEISGLKSDLTLDTLNGNNSPIVVDVANKAVTLSEVALDAKDVEVSAGYTLALSSEELKPAHTDANWTLEDGKLIFNSVYDKVGWTGAGTNKLTYSSTSNESQKLFSLSGFSGVGNFTKDKVADGKLTLTQADLDAATGNIILTDSLSDGVDYAIELSGVNQTANVTAATGGWQYESGTKYKYTAATYKDYYTVTTADGTSKVEKTTGGGGQSFELDLGKALAVKGDGTIDGIDISEPTTGKFEVKITDVNLLPEKDVEITSSDFTLSLGNTIPQTGSSIPQSWETEGDAYKYTAAGTDKFYTCSNNKISYTAATTRSTFTISGLKSGLTATAGNLPKGVTIDNKVVTLSEGALAAKDVEVSAGYTLALSSEDLKPAHTDANWTLEDGKLIFNSVYDKVGWTGAGTNKLTYSSTSNESQKLFSLSGFSGVGNFTKDKVADGKLTLTQADLDAATGNIILTDSLSDGVDYAIELSGVNQTANVTAATGGWQYESGTKYKYTAATYKDYYTVTTADGTSKVEKTTGGGGQSFELDLGKALAVKGDGTIDGIDISEPTTGKFEVKITDVNLLPEKDVEITSSDFTLSLGNTIPQTGSSIPQSWETEGDAYKYTAAGTDKFYTCSNNKISYTAATTRSTFTISGLKSGLTAEQIDSAVEIADKIITFKTTNLFDDKKVVTVSDGYTFKFADDILQSEEKDVSWTNEDGKCNYVSAGDTAGYRIVNNQIVHKEDTRKAFEISGLSSSAKLDDDIVVTGTKAKLLSSALDKRDITINGGFIIELDSAAARSTHEDERWELAVNELTYKSSGDTAGYKQIDNSNIEYLDNPSTDLFTISGLNKSTGILINGDKVIMTATALENRLSDTIKLTDNANDSVTYKLALDENVLQKKTLDVESGWTPKNETTYEYHSDTYKDYYELSGDTVTHHAASGGDTFSISGVANTDNISVNDKVVTVMKASLTEDNVELIGDGFTLALDNDVSKILDKAAVWSGENGNYTYTAAGKTAGYTLSGNKIIYAAAAGGNTISISNLNPEATPNDIDNAVKITGQNDGSYKIVFTDASVLKKESPVITAENGISYTVAVADNIKPVENAASWKLGGTDKATLSSYTSEGYFVENNQVVYSEQQADSKKLSLKNLGDNTSLSAPVDKVVTLKANTLGENTSLGFNDGEYSIKLTGNMKGKAFTGSASDDVINITAKNAVVKGGKGNDAFTVSGSKVTVTGGKGNDTFNLSGKNPVLVYGTGDGKDSVSYVAGLSVSLKSGTKIQSFGKDDSGIVLGFEKNSSIKITNVNDSDTLKVVDADGSITLLASQFDLADKLTFDSENTSVKVAENFTGHITPNDDIYLGNNKLSNVVTINAGKVNGDILIKGNSKSNKIYGGKGNSTLTGGKGADTFVYTSGELTITDYTAGKDKINLNGYSITGATFTNDGKDLVLSLKDGNKKGKLTILNGGKDSDGEDIPISFVEGENTTDYIFEDDKIFNADKTAVTLLGAAGNFSSKNYPAIELIDGSAAEGAIKVKGNKSANSIIGGKGGMTLTGGKGADIFVCNGGELTITDYVAGYDKINLNGYSITGATFTNDGNDLVISLKDGNKEGKLTIQKYSADVPISFIDGGDKIDRVFEDDKIFNADKTAVTLFAATKEFSAESYSSLVKISAGKVKGDLTVEGNDESNKIYGGKVNSTLTGGNGDDTFVYNGGELTITDYTAGKDKINLNDYSITGAIFTNDGKDLVLSLKDGNKEGKLTILNGGKNSDGEDIPISFVEGKKTADYIFAKNRIFNADKTAVTLLGAAGNFSSKNYPDIELIDGSAAEGAIKVKGNKSANSIIGGAVGMTLTGGKGADTFVYTSGELTITDYTAGKDKINLNGYSITGATFTNDGKDLVLSLKDGNKKGKLTIYNGGKNSDGEDIPISFVEGKKTTDYIFEDDKIFNADKTAVTLLGGAGNFSSKSYPAIELIDGSAAEGTIKVTGNKSANSIIGGKGGMTLAGGKGADIFVCNGGELTITDYVAGYDKINLNGYSITGATFTNDGNDLVLSLKDGNKEGKLTIQKYSADVPISFIDGGDKIDRVFEDDKIFNADKTAVTLFAATKEFSAESYSSLVKISAGKVKGDLTVEGNAESNKIYGGKGNSTLTGGNGYDTFVYNGGELTITDYTAGHDKINLNDYSITGAIFTNDGKDLVLSLKDGNKEGKLTILNGGKNSDGEDIPISFVEGKKTADYIFAKNRIFNADKTAVTLLGAAGNFSSKNYPDIELIDGSAAEGAIKVKGNKSANSIFGGAAGMTLTGGKGADTFVYTSGELTITDYTAGKDKINLNGYSITGAIFTNDGKDLVLSLKDGNKKGKLTIYNGGKDSDGEDIPISFVEGENTTDYIFAKNRIFNADKTAVTLLGGAGNFSSKNYPEIELIDGSVAEGAIKVTGNKSANSIIGGKGGMTLTGGKGNDTLIGGKGADVFVYNGSGNDVIKNYSERDKILLSNGSTIGMVTAGKKNVTINVDNNTLIVKNAAGKEITVIEADNTKIISGGNLYDENKVSVTLGSSSDSNIELATLGVKNVDASAMNNAVTLKGSKSANLLVGSAYNDSLLGNNSKDTLYGGNGNDTLWGGKGNDTLYGGDGKDTFIYKPGEGIDTIFDYQSGDMLKILKSNGKSGGTFTEAVFSENKLTLAIDGGGTVIFDGVSKGDKFNINDKTYTVSSKTLK